MRFNDSSLVRQLAAFVPPAAAAPDPGLAQRVAQWLNVADAITLHAAHNALAQLALAPKAAKAVNGTKAGTGAVPPTAAALRQALERTRQTLQASITRRERTLDTEYPLYHQRYQDQQRRMDMSLEALRDHVRQSLAQSSPRLAQLAALDQMLGQMLAPREQRLLAGVPGFLKTRYHQLRTQHQRDTADADALVPVLPQAPWLAQFANEFEQTLLAELELRLQPILGLLEAFSHEPTATPDLT